jgi:hypothetical protein
MAKKNSKKTEVKADKPTPTETTKVPVIVSDIRNVAGNLGELADLPKVTLSQRSKLVDGINKLATRVEKILASAGKKAEREAAKAKREAVKAEKAKAKREKAEKKIADMRKKLEKMEADLAADGK